MVSADVPIGEAIKAALGGSGAIQAFADSRGFTRSAVSGCIHGHQRHEKVRAALAEELGVEREWLDEELDRRTREPNGQAA